MPYWPPSPFSEKNLTIAKAWFENPVNTSGHAFCVKEELLELWNQTKDQIFYEAYTEMEIMDLPSFRYNYPPRWTWNAEHNAAALLKPHIADIAREKISSDLAQILGLPVPPVQIWSPSSQNPKNKLFLSASLRAFFECWGLDDVFAECNMRKRVFEDEISDPFLRGMYVFDTWTGNTNRSDSNVICDQGRSSGQPPRTAYPDNAEAFYCDVMASLPDHIVNELTLHKPAACHDIALATVHKIQNLPDATVKEIVQRLPKAIFVTPVFIEFNKQKPLNKKQTVDYLLERRDNLKKLVTANGFEL